MKIYIRAYWRPEMKDNPVIFSLEPLYFGDEIEQRIRSNHWILFVGKFYGTLSVENMKKIFE